METLPEECDAESQSVETPCVEQTTTKTPPHHSPMVSDPECPRTLHPPQPLPAVLTCQLLHNLATIT